MGENRTVESPAKGSEKRIAELERSVMSFERKSQYQSGKNSGDLAKNAP